MFIRFIEAEIISFRRLAYYHPDQEGTASIKSVISVLTGKSYSELNIHGRGTASLEVFALPLVRFLLKKETPSGLSRDNGSGCSVR
jgi:hypothetical protein